MSDVSDEDDTRILAMMSATSRACRARGIWRTTRHTDKQATQYTEAADLRPTNQGSAWQAERENRPTHRHPREGAHEDATRKLLPWKLSLYTDVD